MPQRYGLGKGLDALIPTGEPAAAVAGGVTQVEVDHIQRNPRQPRLNIRAQELSELAASISLHGVIQPLIVSPAENGRHTLIAGERRWLAAQQVGLKRVPVIVRHASNQEFLELALIENIQRADLNPLEEAEAYRQLVEEFSLSHDAVARRVGKSRAAVTNTLRLLSAADEVKHAVVNELVSEGHARALLALTSSRAQESALRTVVKQNLNVRQTEVLVKKLQGYAPGKKKKKGLNPDLQDLQQRLQSSLGTRVSLRHAKKGGTLTIHYYSEEELDAILGKLLK